MVEDRGKEIRGVMTTKKSCRADLAVTRTAEGKKHDINDTKVVDVST
jgi:hypothetical protein